MTGEESGGDPDKFPYAAPAVAWPALRRIEAILEAARPAGAPVIYTRFAIDREAGDAGLFDAFSYNFRTIVPSDAVFDGMPVSQAINLFDMNRCSADVMETSEVLDYLVDTKMR